MVSSGDSFIALFPAPPTRLGGRKLVVRQTALSLLVQENVPVGARARPVASAWPFWTQTGRAALQPWVTSSAPL